MSKTKKTESIVVIAGEDINLRDEKMASLRKKLLGKDEGIGEIRIDGKNASLREVLTELQTLPFLCEQKVVIIDDADKFVTDNREKLEDYFDNPSPTSVLILVCDSWRKATKLDKKLVNVGELISVEKFKYPSQAVDWVVKRAVEVGLDVLKPVANRLVSVVGVDTGRLGNELEKISIYAGSRKKITEEDVDELCGVTAEESIFELTDKLMERNISGALEILTRILESDRSAEYTLTGAIGFSLRKFLKVKLLIESGTAPYDACKAANIHQPFVIEKTTRLLKNISAKKIQRMLSELLKVDYDNKTGLGKPKMNMEKFVVTANLAG